MPRSSCYLRLAPTLSFLVCFLLLFSGQSPFLAASPVVAAAFQVDTTVDDAALTACDDTTPNDCSLRGAILAANARPAAEASTINVPAGTYRLTQVNNCFFQTTQFGSGTFNTTALCPAGNITLIGAGAASTIIDGNQPAGNLGVMNPVMLVSSIAPVELRGVTIKKGNFSIGSLFGHGGGINNAGTLTIANSVVSDNSTTGPGGGIYNSNTLIIRSSTLTRNATAQDGGAIFNDRGGVVTISDSIISENVGGNGGGIFNFSGTLTMTASAIVDNIGAQGGGIANGNFNTITIVNSTVSGNRARSGGGISNGFRATIRLKSVTVTNNTARWPEDPNRGIGGGLLNMDLSVVTLQNTLIAGNIAAEIEPLSGKPWGADCFAFAGRDAALTSQGYNLIQNAQFCDMSGDTTGNIIGQDAQLGVLTDNGGPTPTHALLGSSPAIDAGNPDGCTDADGNVLSKDQRGELRAVDGDGDSIARCDIGAFETAGGMSLSGIRPNRAGNTSSLVALIYGTGFLNGATVKLTRNGEPDITGSSVTVAGNGSVLTTSFALTGAMPGLWNVTVMNPDGSSVSRNGALMIEQGGASQVWADIVGPPNIRVGYPARFKIFFGNRGTVDAFATPLVLAISTNVGFTLHFPISPPPSSTGQSPSDWDSAAFTVDSKERPDLAIIPLLLPIVPAGFTGTLEFSLLAPPERHGQSFQVLFDIGSPYLKPALDPQAKAELLTGARTYAEDTLGVTLPPEVIPDLEDYLAAQLQTEVTHGRQALLTSGGTTNEVYSQAHLLIDVARFGAAQTAFQTSRMPSEEPGWLAGIARSLLSALLAPSEAHADSCAEQGGIWVTCDNKCGRQCCTQAPQSLCCGTATCRRPQDPPPCTGSSCSPGGGGGGGISGSADPNDKVGSRGAGTAHYLTGAEPLRYVIFFENLATATAPAQIVHINDQLNGTLLDLATLSLGPISFSDTTVAPPPGLSEFTKEVDLRPAQELLVRIEAALNKETGALTWQFTTLDSTTGEPLDPSDPRGFLPPNVTPPEGDGSVVFTVNPKAGLSTGTEIRNQAHIVFDVNAPIDTPEWLNTIDNTKPTSTVSSVAPALCSQEVRVRWSGTDAGAGIASYTVFVSEDDGPFTLWLSNTPDTSGVFTGKWGKQYAFYSLAQDRAGNLEDGKVAPDKPPVTITDADCGAHDLAVVDITAPKLVSLSSKKPRQTKLVKVQIQNRGRRNETIADLSTLNSLVSLTVDSLGTCAAPLPELLMEKPQKTPPVTLKPKQKFTIVYAVSLRCANDGGKGTGREDYQVHAQVYQSALGGIDAHGADDSCPRDPLGVDSYPDGTILDKGCGEKKADKTLGGSVLIDVVTKP